MTTTTAPHDPATVRQIRSDAAAIAAAHDLAARLRPGAAARDRAGAPPHRELRDLALSGLLALPVRRDAGGPGARASTVAEVTRILAVADPAVAQVPQNHFMFVDAFWRFGTPAQRRFFGGEVLRGARLGNALSERGGRTAADIATRLTPGAGDGLRLNGHKYYCTGALTARWLPVLARDGDILSIAYVPRDADGVAVEQDWNAFGQRATVSGSAAFEDVEVRPEWVLRDVGRPVLSTFAAFGQIIHAAIDVGIARGAFEDGVAVIRDRARPWFEAQVERAVDEPHVLLGVGRLRTRLAAAEALLAHASAALDEADAHPSPERINRARLEVATAKAVAGETALEIATGILKFAGASGTDAEHALDRHWRNARTHTLHDANRFKYVHLGNWELRDLAPPPDHPLI